LKYFLIGLIVATSLLSAKKEYGNIVVDNIVSVYDGDTIKVNIKSYPPIVGQKISIRISGIDTPEIRAKCYKEKKLAIKARELVKSILLNSTSTIELRNIKRGKYFRLVADVYIDGKSVADTLITNNLAVRYYGGKKIKDWCK
jgi:endonuclease YncB( thermonuclease family)